MAIHHQIRAWFGGILRRKLRKQAASFFSVAENCEAAQRAVLRDLLSLNADSEFNQHYGLDKVASVDDFRSALPVSDYELFRPWIERAKEGEHSAILGSENRLLMFCLSSGTTADSKFIPVTERFLTDYRRGWSIWGIGAFDTHPAMNALNILQLSSNYDRFRSPGGTPCGNISGLVAAMQTRIVRSMYTAPRCLSEISETELKQYVMLRISLADRRIGMITTANPSTLIHLARFADDHREQLIRDLFDGTLNPDFALPESLKPKLARKLRRRHVKRARELERMIESRGQLLPRDYWPNLQLLAVWTGGSAGAYLRTLRKLYGEKSVRDHGLHASEGRMTIPIADETSSGLLDVGTHFFEFIPEREIHSDNPTVLMAHELQEGESYFILLTTSSGLYRYHISDVVRCTGFFHTTPLLEFLHKGAHIANITGEKISESQVVQAVRQTTEALNLELQHFTLAPVWGEPPGYRLLIEETDGLSETEATRLAESTETNLQQLNCEYQEKRESGRLIPIQCERLPSGTWKRFAASRQQGLGGSVEQYKHPCLKPDLDFYTHLHQHFTHPNGN